MGGKIDENRFVELMNQIPVMAVKLDRILNVMEQIAENGAIGLNRKFDGDTAFDFDPAKVKADKTLQEEVRKRREHSRKLAAEADEIERELEI